MRRGRAAARHAPLLGGAGAEAEPPRSPPAGGPGPPRPPAAPTPTPTPPAPALPAGREGERLLRLCLVKLVMYHVNYQCDLKMVAGPRKINGNPNSNYVAGVKELN